MPVEGSNHQFRRVLQTQQHFVGMKTKIVLEGWIDAVQHLDIRACREEFVARSREQDHVHIIVHARLENGVIQLPVHLVGVSVRRWIIHLNNSNAGIVTVINQSLLRFGGSSCHMLFCPLIS